MDFKGLIFDLDGTLLDSMSIWETAGEDYIRSLGYEVEPDLRRTLTTMSLVQCAEYLQQKFALPMTVEEVINGINKSVEGKYFYDVQPKEHVIPFLERMYSKGMKMCVATATDRYQVEAALKRCGMSKYFGEIFTCSEVGSSKNEPHIYDRAREYLGFGKDEVAIFEDAYHAAKTAKNAGYYVVGLADKYERHQEELKTLADVFVDNLSELTW